MFKGPTGKPIGLSESEMKKGPGVSGLGGCVALLFHYRQKAGSLGRLLYSGLRLKLRSHWIDEFHRRIVFAWRRPRILRAWVVSGFSGGLGLRILRGS